MSDAEGQAAATATLDQSAFAHLEALLREDTKGEYVVGPMLGRGGMAVVYLATETMLSRKVALKVLPPELTFGHGVERFKREAKTAAALDHPNIIPIYRIGSSGKIFWYAMKFLEGKSLEDMLRERGAFSLDETIEILEQVADGLDYAHEHHVIHRDIKPANVMLDNRNKVIVTDFGIAKALTEGKLTATDSVIGTPYFMSPEQGMGKTVSGASDQYSVAVMAYRMLAGHVPFDGDSAIDILHKHCMFEAPILHEDVPEIPVHVSDAVARGLSKKGDERFASVHDLVQSMKDPEFVPKVIARPSGATVVMSSSEVRKGRAQATKPISNSAASTTGKGRTAKTSAATPADDKTILAAPAARTNRAKTVAAPAPEPKSKAGLFAMIGIVVVVGGGIAAWQLTKTPASEAATNGPTPGLQSIPPAQPNPSPDSSALALANAASTPPVVNAVTPTRTPDTRPPPPRPTSAASKSGAPSSRQPAQTPRTQGPAPPTTPAPASTPTPVVAEPARTEVSVQTGILQLVISPPGIVEIDSKDLGEKSRFAYPLTEGTHILRVRKEGFISFNTTVDIKAGTTTVQRVNLEPRP